MRSLLPLAVILALNVSVSAQTITNITFNPSQISECDPVVITMFGTLPNGSYMVTNFAANVVGGDINFTMNAAGTGSGGGVNFSQSSVPVGPWPAGTYTFNGALTLNGGAAVDTWTTTLTITAGMIPDPGQDTFIDICNSISPFSLTGALDGSPDTWGVWLDGNGLAVPSTFIPGTHPAGLYVYTFAQGGTCVDTTSQLFITYVQNTSAGANTQAQVCNDGPPVNLFTLINPSPTGGPAAAGGTWTGPGGPFSGMFDPTADPTGNYTYTVTGQAPCGNPSSTMTVSLAGGGNAGNGGVAIICEDDTTQMLDNFITGAHDTIGNWYDPFGFVLPNGWRYIFNPMIDLDGTYHYIVDLQPCAPDSAAVSITIDLLPCDISVEELDGNVDQFLLLPNPANDQVTVFVKVQQPDAQQRLQIITTTGVLVDERRVTLQQQRDGMLTIDIHDLPQGTYLMRLYSQHGSVVRYLVKS